MDEEVKCTEKYKQYSPFYMTSFGKIDIWKLFCPDWRYFDKSQMTLRDFFKEISPFRNNVVKEGDGLFAFIYSRNKENGWGGYHAQFFYQLCTSCNDRSVITVAEEKHLSWYAFLSIPLTLFWYIKCKSLGFSQSTALALTVALYNVKNDTHELLKSIDRHKIVVTYCDMFSADHYLIRILNKKKIVTVTAQHGIFYRHGYNYLLSESKYFIANCKLSKEYAMECGKKKVYSPGLMASISELPRTAMIKNRQFLVLVDGFDSEDEPTIASSKYILELADRFADEYGYNYVVRYHPMNTGAELHNISSRKIARISGPNESTMEVINEAEFVVMGRSTVWFQAVSLLCPTFRYIGFEDDYMSDIRYNGFENYEDLVEVYQKSLSQTLEDLKRVKEEYLGSDDTLRAYQSVWRDIAKKESRNTAD